MDYKRYIKEAYGLDKEKLVESPNQIPSFLKTYDNDILLNTHESEKVEKNWERIGNFKFSANNFRIFKSIEEGNYVYYSLLAEEHPVSVLYHNLQLKNLNINNETKHGILSLDIWSDRARTKGIARDWVLRFILKNYDFVLSDMNHTKEGKYFWTKLIEESLNHNNLIVNAYNYRTKEFFNIKIKEEIEQYYQEGKTFYQLLIINK